MMKTFFMIKPDGVKRNLIGEIISRVEEKGFQITKIKMITISQDLAENITLNIRINHFLVIL